MSIPFNITDAGECLVVVRNLLFLAMAVGSLQHIYNAADYGRTGLMSWSVQKYVYSWTALQGNFFDLLFGQRGFVILHLLRMGLTGLVVFGPARVHTGVGVALLLTAILALHALLYLRSYLTMTGADQLQTILLGYLMVCGWWPDGRIMVVVLCALAVQVLWCYASNGLVKILEPGWRDGTHLKAILQTQDFSRPAVAQWAAGAAPGWLRVSGVLVVGWELSALAVPWLPLPCVGVYLAAGVIFHIAIALVMGLNGFFWTFLSSYPAILFLAYTVSRLLA